MTNMISHYSEIRNQMIQRIRRSHGLALAAAMVVLASVAACSSSSTSSPASGASPASTSAAGADVAALAQHLTTRPTTIPSLGKPIGKPIPAGKTVYTVDCGLPACILESQLVGDAAKSLGWTWKDLKTDGTPQQLSGAWQQVISDKVNFAVAEGSPMSEIGPYVHKAAANGTVVISLTTTDPPGNGLAASISNGESLRPLGNALAIWAANEAKSSGQSKAGAVYVNIPDFPVLQPEGAQFQASLSHYCPGCTGSELNVGLSNLQNAPDLVISYLRAHPNVKYIAFSAINAFDAVPPAIKAAGLHVQIAGTTPDATSLDQLRSGMIQAVVPLPQYEAAYAAVDVMARYAAGVQSTNPPAPYVSAVWLNTKSNVPAGNVYPVVANVASEYAKIWGK
jgi:hypothetical protein